MTEKKTTKQIYINSAYAIDQVLLDEDERIVILKFQRKGKFKDFEFFQKSLKIKKRLENFFSYFRLDYEKIRDFNLMYELFGKSAYIFFFKNKRIFIDHGSGNNNKIEKHLMDQKIFLKLVEGAYKHVKKGKNFFFLRN